MNTLFTAYTFDASAQEIVFTGYTSLPKKVIKIIVNVEDGIIIYNFADPAKGGTITPDAGGDILTLEYDTSLMDDTDELMIVLDDLDNGLNLLYSELALHSTRLLSIVNQLPAALGQATKANSLPVTLASDEDNVNVDVASLPALPAGTNNIGDVDVLSLPAIPAGTNNIGDVDVLTLPSIPAGNNNIGDVDIASIAAGDNNIGNVDVVTLPSIPAGTNNIGDVDVLTLPALVAGTAIIGKIGIDQTTPGTTNGVQINAALPAGTNAIGKLAANSGVDIGDVDVTSLPALVAGTAIIGKVGIDQTTPGTTNGVQINAALPAGSNAIGKLAANSGVDIGDVDVTSLPGIAGDIAHDAGDSGNPVKVGAKAANALPTAVANNDRTHNISDLWGRVLTSHIDPGMQLAITKTAFNATSTQTGAAMWTPASGKRIAITSLVIGTYGTTAARVIIWIGASGDTTYTAGTDHAVVIASFAPSATVKPGLVFTPAVPIFSATADHILKITTDAGISIDVTWSGYEF